MRLPNSILYLSIDPFLSVSGKPAPGLEDFLVQVEHAVIPAVWFSSRTRFQLETPRRALAHNHPFIAEGGCGVYIPEGYFNVRAHNAVRLGRFMCIPVADQQPAAANALELLSIKTAVSTVPLKELSPRELAQNTGLPAREASPMTHRDFDELFFFAGATEDEIVRFQSAGREQHVTVRRADSFWSIACGASAAKCVRELNRLYQRAWRTRIGSAAVAVAGDELLSACDRTFVLRASRDEEGTGGPHQAETRGYLREHDLWERILAWAIRKQR